MSLFPRLYTAVTIVTNPDGSKSISFNGDTRFVTPAHGGLLGLFVTAANVLVFITASISVIMIIVGGLMYVLSTGVSSKTSRAKDTILYAVVGFALSLTGYAIIGFVNKAITK